jgi:hypothetical protein
MDRLSYEVIYDQIPFLRSQLIASAMELRKELAAPSQARRNKKPAFNAGLPAAAITVPVLENPREEESRAALRDALERDVLPYLRGRGRSRLRLARRQIADNWFGLLRVSVPVEYREKVDEMRRWCEERREMDLQTFMQRRLHYWLFVHVPASLLLLIWTAWHAVTGLFYY